MNPFDPYFERIREYENNLKNSGRSVRVWHTGPLNGREEAFRQTFSPLILKENTAVELGGPQTAGSAFMMWTEDVSLIFDGRITLVGQEVVEAVGGRLPFGQVIMAGGSALGTETHSRLEREQYIAERVPGYMVRSTGGRIWSRASYEALDNGFSLRSLGANILSHIRDRLPVVAAAEILFVTSSIEDVQDLEKIGAQVRKLSHDLRRERIKQTADGKYECESDISCEACPDNEVCSEIREILVIRKKGGQAQPSS